MGQSSDAVIWVYAEEHGFTLVTQDADFSEMSEALGFPPKVIWIRRGNCSTSEIGFSLRLHFDAIIGFNEDPAIGILTII
jgi:predicted nuclease of predicted toxin-antitoxin system